MRSLVLKVVLVVVALGLSYWLYEIIQAPIRFENQKMRRMEVVKEKLIAIRTAQAAFKEVNGEFAPSFERLTAFVDTGSLLYCNDAIQVIATSMNCINKKTLRIPSLLIHLDTPQLKILCSAPDLETMHTIPFSNGKDFEMDAGKIVKEGGLVVQVFMAMAPKELYLRGLDRTLIKPMPKTFK
jgi:hypothetical protein